MTQLHHERIKYQHAEFAIHRLVEDCPPRMVVRELTKNAEEVADEHAHERADGEERDPEDRHPAVLPVARQRPARREVVRCMVRSSLSGAPTPRRRGRV